jgi:hypothetical protein
MCSEEEEGMWHLAVRRFWRQRYDDLRGRLSSYSLPTDIGKTELADTQ